MKKISLILILILILPTVYAAVTQVDPGQVEVTIPGANLYIAGNQVTRALDTYITQNAGASDVTALTEVRNRINSQSQVCLYGCTFELTNTQANTLARFTAGIPNDANYVPAQPAVYDNNFNVVTPAVPSHWVDNTGNTITTTSRVANVNFAFTAGSTTGQGTVSQDSAGYADIYAIGERRWNEVKDIQVGGTYETEAKKQLENPANNLGNYATQQTQIPSGSTTEESARDQLKNDNVISFATQQGSAGSACT